MLALSELDALCQAIGLVLVIDLLVAYWIGSNSLNIKGQLSDFNLSNQVSGMVSIITSYIEKFML